MQTNVKPKLTTFEGGPSSGISPINQLKRLVSTCLLGEDTFYVDGQTVSKQIEEVCKRVDSEHIIHIAYNTFEKGLLRHIPLFLIVQALKKGAICSNIIATICTRPDQMTELLSLYWKDGRKPISNQLKKGLAKAFTNFDEYQLAKYNRDNPIKLKDILFLCHAKPKDVKQEILWRKLIAGELKTPDTWEVRLSSGANKKQSFEELLQNQKMGRLAILRNLRNMYEANIDMSLVRKNLLLKSRPLLPFQFLSAAKACPTCEHIIDESMIDSLHTIRHFAEESSITLEGKTLLMVDVSGSMDFELSGKSVVNRMDAACGIAILLREICPHLEIYTFSNNLETIPLRRGIALRDAIVNSQSHHGTYLGLAFQYLLHNQLEKMNSFDRVIVITDEQVHDKIPKINIDKKYIINIAPYQNGIANHDNWHIVNGFSENVIHYIKDYEDIF